MRGVGGEGEKIEEERRCAKSRLRKTAPKVRAVNVIMASTLRARDAPAVNNQYIKLLSTRDSE